jgi:hypothetical protein
MRTNPGSRLGIAGSVLAMLLAQAALPPAAVKAISGPVAPSAAQIDEAIEMREALGFPADRQTVSKLLQSADAQYDFGGPLSADETLLMQRRIEFEQASTGLISYVNDQHEIFGGAWFDHPDGDARLWVATTDAAGPDTLARLSDLVPAGLEVKLVRVGVSMAALRAGQDAVMGAASELGVSGSYVDVTTNELVVGASSELAADLEGKLGVPVRAEPMELVPVACSSRASCTPYRAAIHVNFPNQLCTWSFIAKTNLVAQLNVMSAGHCATLGQAGTHNSVTVTSSGGVNRDTFDMIGTQQADALRGALKSSANLAQPYNLLYNTDTQKALTLTSKEGYATQTVGETACFVGRSSGNLCGQIEAIGVTGTAVRFNGTSKSFSSLIRMNRSAVAGDSGAPVRFGYTALGLVGFADPNHSGHAVYGAIDKVENAMDVKICITSSCGL